jgi:hypothetical protein
MCRLLKRPEQHFFLLEIFFEFKYIDIHLRWARVAEKVDARDLKSLGT